MKRYRSRKFTLLSSLLAAIYWFADSSIHYFLYVERRFEIIPSKINELWMRIVIIGLLLIFGMYVDISVGRLKRLYKERNALLVERDHILTKLLSGYVSICSVCKKVKVEEDNTSHNSPWQTIETYISKRTDLLFSHSYCEDCARKVIGDINAEDK